jgi:hypothetical protein
MGSHLSRRLRQHRPRRLCDCGLQRGRWGLKNASEATAKDSVEKAAIVREAHRLAADFNAVNCNHMGL